MENVFKESIQITVHRMILITLLSLKLVHCISNWNVESTTCHALEDKDLQFLSECNVTLDEKKYLHASCDFFCYAENKFPFVGSTKSMIVITWKLRTDKPVISFNDTKCLRFSALVIEKMPNFNNYGLHNSPGTLLKLLPQLEGDLSVIEEGRIEAIFQEQRIVAVATNGTNCDINNPQFELSAVDSKRNTSCKIAIRGITKMIYPAQLFGGFPTTESQAIDVLKKINEVFLLDKARIPLLRIKFTKNVLDVTQMLLFISFYKIECLEFPQNNFRYFRNGEQFSIASLRVFNLTEAAIEMIENGAFDKLPGLETVDLSWNRLNTIPEVFYVPHLKHLTYLNMEGNKPSNGGFTLNSHNKQLSHISVLRLSKISFTELKPRSFVPFPNLTVLYLDHCNFTYIEDGVLCNLTSLITLDLSHNQIANISTASFASLLSLKYLNLSNNRLEIMPVEVIQTLSNLSQLDLQNNLISTFTFFAHPSLTLINLRGNRIREWHMPEDLLPSYDLDLSSNLISYLTGGMRRKTEGVSVNLAENPFDCSACNLYYLHLWFNGSEIDNPDEYVCSSPPEVRSYSIFALSSMYEDCLEKEISNWHVIISLSLVLLFMAVCGVAAYYYRWSVRLFCFRLKAFVWHYKESSCSYEYHAYIAHCDSLNSWIASELIPQLESDKSNIKLHIRGRDFNFREYTCRFKHVEKIIPKCGKFVLLLSNDFLISDWYEMAKLVIYEMLLVDCLILVKMEELREDLVDKLLHYLMKTRTCLQWPANRKDQCLFWEKLRSSIIRGRNPDMPLKPIL